ncbi:MAG TPA: hypothetical protein PKA88_10340 [Polyangiaceae bacterium]|nr:hypothetical protein [Polyangiaceae bacterium]
MGPIRSLVAAAGATIIYGLIWLFGRKVRRADVPWLDGPVGTEHIGDRPYEECARAEGLELVRNATEGGLVPDFDALTGSSFDASRADAAVRDFYEHTARYRMDVWAKTWFPANVALWLLVTTISRKVNQLNFPVDNFETAAGMDSEIVLLRRSDGTIRYTGWFRRLVTDGRVLYTGFYMTGEVPEHSSPCVKVIFPMPGGNATVILRPEIAADGTFVLDSSGKRFGDVGFYRIQRVGERALRVWRIRTLKEKFRLYLDAKNVLRCDHAIRFLGLPVLRLHYRIERTKPAAARADALPA